MSLTYGYDLKDNDDIIAAPIQAIEIMSRLVLPGAAMVNHLPFCWSFILPHPYCWLTDLSPVRHIPSWIPWFSYGPLARIGGKLSHRMKNEPIDFVKNAMVCGCTSGIPVN